MRKYFVLYVLIFSSSLWSNNYHDHLYGLPSADSFTKHTSEILSIPDSELRLNNFFGGPRKVEDLEQFMVKQLGINQFDSKRFVTTAGDPLEHTMKDLMRMMDGTNEQKLTKFVTMGTGDFATTNTTKSMYRRIESFRSGFIQSLDVDTCEKIFRDYFASEILADRKVINLTVPSTMFEGAGNLEKLERLKKVATEAGSEVNYYYSITRRDLTKSSMSRNLSDNLRTLVAQKKIVAIDITGSIMEDLAHGGKSVENIQRRLTEVFEFASEKNITLRVHAFEGSNSGNFYDALKNVMNSYDRPIRLEMGHINMLDEGWLDTISRNKNITPLLDANIASNVHLQGADIEKLEKIIEQAGDRGIPVRMGSDGRGIFPDDMASFHQQAEDLLHTQGAINHAGGSIIEFPRPADASSCLGRVLEAFAL